MSTTARGTGTFATLVPLLLGLALGLLVPLAPQLRTWLQQQLGSASGDALPQPSVGAATAGDSWPARRWHSGQHPSPGEAAGGPLQTASAAPPGVSAGEAAARVPTGPASDLRSSPFWDSRPEQEARPRATAATSLDVSGDGAPPPSGAAVLPASHARHVPSAQLADDLDQLQRRFVELGAAYLRLETWGAQRQLYRFRCEMPLPGNPAYHQYFESVDASPAAAMQRVLAAVEAWQARQQASTVLR